MKKRIISALLAVSMILTLAACGGKPAAAPAAPAAPAADGAKPAEGAKLSGTVTVWSWDVALAHLQAEAEKFNKIHPDVKFVFEEMGVSQVYSKMTTSLQSGIGLPDIVSLEGEQMAKFGEKFPDKFVDLTNEMNPADYLPIKIAECTSNGKILAYPWDAGPCGMFYRQDLFDKAGIKAESIITWDDFIAAGKVLKEKTGCDMMVMAESRKDTTYRLLMMELGGFYFDKDGKTVVNSAESIRAMGMIQKLYQAGITFNDSSWDDMVASISGSKVACIAEAVWMAGSIKDAAPDQSGKWRVMDLPRFDADKEAQGSSNGGSVLVVPSTTKNRDAAVEFVKFAMTDKSGNEEGFLNYGLYPSYIPALDAEIFKKGDEYFGGQKIYDIFKAVGTKVPMVNYTANFAEAIDLSKNAVSKVTLDKADPAKVMNDLQAEMVAKFGK